MPKLIREGRFGPPKSYKTGSILSSYPKPILSIVLKKEEMDICREPVTWIPLADFAAACKQPMQPPISAITAGSEIKFRLSSDDYNIPKDATSWPNVVKVINHLLDTGCPWKTIVFDNASDLSTAIVRHLSATNNGMLADARKWAPAVSSKIEQLIELCSQLPAHFVIIMHEETDKNEVTSEISTTPALYAKYRERVAAGLSQFLYQKVENGKPVVYLIAQGFVKGLGSRLFTGKESKCEPVFSTIYADAIKTGEIEKP